MLMPNNANSKEEMKIGKQNTHVTPQDKADPGYICKFPH